MKCFRFSVRLRVAMPALLSLFLTAESLAQPPIDNLPVLDLPEQAQGVRALNAIGNRLPAWAEAYDMSVPEFARTLREDEYGFLDERGKLFFIEPDADQTPTANADVYSSPSYPLEQTFLLESRPDSPLTIYLDFDGHVLEGTAWNANGSTDGTGPIVAQAWSRDGDRTSFSDSELRDIQTIWRRVSEDFAPFDVNVTTRYPGEDALARTSSDDPFFGTRVLFTPNTFYNCSCGGVAYVGILDSANSVYYQPALVFNGGVSSAAEAASHEVGHNGGLSHDGTSSQSYYTGHGSGATGWAPIMGVGYNRQLVQWSRGEYADANQSQDDYQVFANNRLPVTADDHGDDTQSATVAAVSGDSVTSTIDIRGVIESPLDRDFFQITAGAGALSLQASPVAASPNLDIGLSLLDNSGNVVAESNVTDMLATGLILDVTPGQYFIAVEGVGKGDPLGAGYTDYGSLGGFVVTGQFPNGGTVTPPSAAISTPDYTPGFAPLAVTFDGSQSTDAVRYDWDFGDGTVAYDSDAVVGHTYGNPGTFTIQLVVTNAGGLTDTASVVIDVINQAPIASGSLDKAVVEVGEVIGVSDNGSYDVDTQGAIVAYDWDFGDGRSASGTAALHSYIDAGAYAVTLTVTDDLGATGSTDVGMVEVVLPPIVEGVASGGVSIAGTLGGDFSSTQVADGNVMTLTERMSGGKKRNRYSYAGYDFQVTAPSGQSIVRVLGRQSSSSDGDVFALTWSIDGKQGLVGELSAADAWIESAPFVHPSGTLDISLADSDRTPGGSSLDSAYIDAIAVVTDTTVDSGDGGGDGSGGDGGDGDGGDGGGPGAGNLSLQLVDAWKVKGRNHVRISWSPSDASVQVLRNGIDLGVQSGGSFLDDQLGKGGMTLQYQVCDGTDCSPTLTVAF